MQAYTTREAAELLELSPRQIRSFVRAGVITPGRGARGRYRFSFQDMVLLKTAQELASAGVPLRRIRQAMRRLMRQLPTGRPLSAVRISADHARVVIREAGVAWDPETGQTLLDFEVGELANRLAPAAAGVMDEAISDPAGMDAEAWYALGTELEAVAPEEAAGAYRRAVAADPNHADARVNLGRLHQEQGNHAAAQAEYRAALASDPANATAAFNLGTTLEDQGRTGQAIELYRRAVELEPSFTDAHFNLARLYERTGERDAALRHLRSYRALRG